MQNSLIYSVGNFLTRGIGFFLIPIYTRYLSTAEYGLVDFFIMLGSIISFTIALEINQAVVRFYQDASTQKDKMEYVSTAFSFTVFVYVIYFGLSWIFSDFLTVFFLYDISYRNIFLLASLAIATNGLFYFTSAQLRWQILPKHSVVVSVTHVAFFASIACYLLMVKNLKVESIFIGQIGANVISTLLSIYWSKNSYQFIFVYKKFVELVSFSYPLVFSSVSIFVSLFIDRILIKEILGLGDLGVYAVAIRFASISSIILFAFQSSLSPLIYKSYKSQDTPRDIAKLFNIFCIFTITVICASFLFSKELVMLMTTPAYHEAASVLPQLIVGFFFAGMYVFFPGLAIEKKMSLVAYISIFGALMNALLNLTLIPVFGLMGASLATMLSSIIAFGVQAHVSQKYYFIEASLAKKALMFSLCVSGAVLFGMYLNTVNLINSIIKFMFVMFVFFSLLYFLLDEEYFKKLEGLWLSKKKMISKIDT